MGRTRRHDRIGVGLRTERRAQFGMIEFELVRVVQRAAVLGVDHGEGLAGRDTARQPHRGESFPATGPADQVDPQSDVFTHAGAEGVTHDFPFR